ncbi:MAG: acetylglutamate kinase [Planctomycetota bacterium]
MEHLAIIKTALPYIRKFRKKTFVIKLGGEVVRDEEKLDSLAEDISLLHNVGIDIVVVHGGGPQADEMLSRLGIEPKYVNGRRVTDDQTLDIVKMVFSGKINIELIAALRKWGAETVGLSGVDAGIITARRRGAKMLVDENTGHEVEVDFGHVGDITAVDTDLIRLLLAQDYVPVICSLASDEDGSIYNINADTVATALAQALKAEKLVVLTDVPGILRDKSNRSTLVSYLDADELRRLLASGAITEGMRPKVEACLAAVENGVRRAHVIDGTARHALLEEIFTNAGSGTMVAAKKESAPGNGAEASA